MTPEVAVVIAAHNGERHVDETLRSVREQTLREIEIVVVDDGSTDCTAAIVERHATEDPRVRRLALALGSAGAARNAGRRATTAPFVANLDQDDLAEPARLERQAAFLRSHPGVGLVGAWWHMIDDDGRRRGSVAPAHELSLVTARIRAGELGHVTHATATFRREALEAVGGYREFPGTSVEDIDLYARIGERWSVANVPEFLGSWRVHSANASRDAATMARWELLVEASARERRAGRADPLGDRDLAHAPGDDELARLGVSAEDVRARAFWWRLAWARLAITLGDAAAAGRELEHAEPGSRAEAAARLATYAHLDFAAGRRRRALAAAARAAAVSPGRTLRTLVRPVGSHVGRAVFDRLPDGPAAAAARRAAISMLNRVGSGR